MRFVYLERSILICRARACSFPRAAIALNLTILIGSSDAEDAEEEFFLARETHFEQDRS